MAEHAEHKLSRLFVRDDLRQALLDTAGHQPVTPSQRLASSPATVASLRVRPLRPASRAASPGDHAMKRAFDVAVSLILLVVLAPGLIALAVGIRATSPGPVFFREKRYGAHNALFDILKFRTMFVDQTDSSGVRQTRKDDPRVTPLGRLIRRASLDELPQLINVVRGDMSLVGPRPHVPGMLAGGMLYETLVPTYFERHRARPGITGLAQVNGFRGSTESVAAARARIDLDNLYIEQWSLRLDAKILWETARVEFLSGSGV